MSADGTDPRTDTEIESEAAAWIIRMEGEPSEHERECFAAWRKEDARHELACHRLQTVWLRAGLLKQVAPVSPEIDADLLKPRAPGWFSSTQPVLRWVAARLIPSMVVAAAAWIALLPLMGTSYETPAGVSQRIQLADGSAADVGPSSEIRVRMTDAARIVELERGDVRFTVHKDPGRPFDVRAGERVLRATGTIFSVTMQAAQLIEMEVTEGSVVVGRRGEEAELTRDDPAAHPAVYAGERLTIRGNTVLIDPRADRRVTLRRRPLAEAIREFNYFYRQPIRIADRSLHDVVLSGSFRALNRQGFLENLADLDIRSQDRGHEIVLFR